MPASLKATKKEIVTAFRTREILAAARSLLEQRGPEAMTMEEIAAAAGVAKGTVYLYFQSKDDLIQALITQVGENILQDVEASLEAPGTPPEKLIRMVSVLLEYLNRERLLFPIYARELLRGEGESREGFRRRYQELEEQFVTLVTRLFAEGIAAGQFIPANPRLLTFLIRGLVRATGYYQKAEGQADAAKEALPVILTLTLLRFDPGKAIFSRGSGAMTARNLWRGLGLVLILWGATVFPGGTAEPPATHLDLKEALRLAWKANPNLQISRLQALIAGEQVVRARSGLLPQVKTQVSQTIYDDPLKFSFRGWGQLSPDQPELLEQPDLREPVGLRLLGHPVQIYGGHQGTSGQSAGHHPDPGQRLSDGGPGVLQNPPGQENGGSGQAECL